MIDTVIFDMGKVLIDFRWEDLYHDLGLTGERFERMANATVRNPIWNTYDRGDCTEEEMFETFIKNAPELEDVINDLRYNHFREFLEKFDYTDEWIDSLKKAGYKVYILSNFSEKAFVDCADKLDYVKKADGAVISYKVHMVKPDPEIYEYTLRTFGIDPAGAVFIDDTAANIEAAKKFGINTVLFKGKSQADEELKKLGVRY